MIKDTRARQQGQRSCWGSEVGKEGEVERGKGPASWGLRCHARKFASYPLDDRTREEHDQICSSKKLSG